MGRHAAPPRAPEPCRAGSSSPEQERPAAKRKRARSAIPIGHAASAALWPDAGECQRGDIRQSPDGLLVYSGKGREEIALPAKPDTARSGDCRIRRRHRRQTRRRIAAAGASPISLSAPRPSNPRAAARKSSPSIRSRWRTTGGEIDDDQGSTFLRQHPPPRSARTVCPPSDIDRLIRDLAAARAKMTPVHPAEPPSDPG